MANDYKEVKRGAKLTASKSARLQNASDSETSLITQRKQGDVGGQKIHVLKETSETAIVKYVPVPAMTALKKHFLSRLANTVVL